MKRYIPIVLASVFLCSCSNTESSVWQGKSVELDCSGNYTKSSEFRGGKLLSSEGTSQMRLSWNPKANALEINDINFCTEYGRNECTVFKGTAPNAVRSECDIRDVESFTFERCKTDLMEAKPSLGVLLTSTDETAIVRGDQRLVESKDIVSRNFDCKEIEPR